MNKIDQIARGLCFVVVYAVMGSLASIVAAWLAAPITGQLVLGWAFLWGLACAPIGIWAARAFTGLGSQRVSLDQLHEYAELRRKAPALQAKLDARDVHIENLERRISRMSEAHDQMVRLNTSLIAEAEQTLRLMS